MNNKVFVSCAVTGSGDTASKHPDLPKTPEQIATASIEAAKAGAAIAHIHVREEDGNPSRRLELYKEVVDRIKSSDTDVILNLTTGMDGDLDIGQGDNPLDFGPMTDMANVMERIANAEQFLPEICTLDAGTLNFGDSSTKVVRAPWGQVAHVSTPPSHASSHSTQHSLHGSGCPFSSRSFLSACLAYLLESQ